MNGRIGPNILSLLLISIQVLTMLLCMLLVIFSSQIHSGNLAYFLAYDFIESSLNGYH